MAGERRVLTLGGKGSSLSSASVFEFSIASPPQLLKIDPSALARISSSPSGNKPVSQSAPSKLQLSVSDFLTPEEAKASILLLLYKQLLSGHSSSSSVASQLSNILAIDTQTPTLDLDFDKQEDISIVRDCWPDITLNAICALLDYTTTSLTTVADAVAALSCEALKADTSTAFNLFTDSGDGFSDKDRAAVASDFKVLLNGSKLRGNLKCPQVNNIPRIHGRLRSLCKSIHSSARIELNTFSSVNEGFNEEMAALFSSLAFALKSLAMVTRTIDLRSDTVTKPTETMRLAMAKAEVDDDVLIYDPTARQLETEMARITGKEAALFVPSGTMGNLISVLVHCEIRGSEVILGNNSHIHIYENGGISTIGGVHPRAVKNNEDGTMDIDLIESAIRHPDFEICYPKTRLICLENSHANTGGRCLSVEYTDQVGELAKKHGLKLHIDGARIFNASVALGVPVHRLVQAADSVSVCLSKGLGAPVGSVIVGTKSFIARARILRKTLGGGMRQVGILCAAALVALQENVGKLGTDHKNAKTLAEGLNKIKGLRVDVASVETNIVYFDILEDAHITAMKLGKIMEEHGILLMPDSSSRVRIVIHHQVSASDVQYTLSCIKQAVTGVADENGGK